MLKSLLLFFRKNYKLFSVVLFVILFFIFYNTYLVDRSLINLRLALKQASQAKTLEDLEKIKPLLKIPLLKEVSASAISSKTLVSMEMAENITTSGKTTDQIEDLVFYLSSVIMAKEKKRGPVLSALDRLNNLIFKPVVKTPKQKLEALVKSLLAKIGATKDKELLQQLYYDLGNTNIELNNTTEAERAFLNAAQLQPESPLALKARFNLAWLYKSTGEYDKAITHFKQLSQEYPGTEIGILSEYELADTYFKKGDYRQAKEIYAQLANKYPEFEAREIASFSTCAIPLYYGAADIDASAQCLTEVTGALPQAEITTHIETKTLPGIAKEPRRDGYRLLKEGRYTEAIVEFERAVRINPDDARALVGQALGFHWLGERQEALYRAEKAINIAPQDEIVVINTMFAYIKYDRLTDAIKIGEAALAKQPVRGHIFHYNLGYAYMLNEDINKAIVQFESALKINSRFVFAYNNLGYALWAKTMYYDSIRRFKEAADREVDYLEAHYNLGVAYFYLNRFEEAYKEFKQILSIVPTYKKTAEYLNRAVEMLKYTP